MQDLSKMRRETKLFKGYKFGQSVLGARSVHLIIRVLVVVSDPKAKNGEEDKKGLLKL